MDTYKEHQATNIQPFENHLNYFTNTDSPVATMATMDNSLHYTSVNHAYHLIGAINQLRQNSELCDITLNCGTMKIPAHKLILSVSSPYFKSLMSLRPQIVNNVTEIQLNGIDSKGVSQIIEFFYTSAISVTEENVWSLLPAASLLQSEEIQNLCCDFLSSQLQAENCLQIHKVATRCLCSALLSETTDYIKTNFEKVLEEEVFLELTIEDLIEHLKRMNEVVFNEEQLLQAIKCWIIHSIDDRQSHGLKIINEFPKVAEKLEDFIPLELMKDDEDKDFQSSEILNGENHSTQESSHVDNQNISETKEFQTKGDNSKDQATKEEDSHMCFECAEVFDMKEELVSHVLTHKLPTRNSTPEVNSVNDSNLSFKDSSLSPNSNHFNDSGLNTNHISMDFKESLNSIQFETPSLTPSSSLFDDYMRSRGLDGPEFGLPSVQTTMKSEVNSMVPTKQFTIMVTNSMKEGTEYDFICPVCGKSYVDKDTLSRHLETHAGFVCSECGKSYTTKSNLQTHMRKHNGEKPYNCNQCDKSFTSHCVLKVHLRTHTGEKPFACPTCGVSFAKNIHLKRHLSIHTGIKPHECKVCGKRFSRSDHLKRHVQSIHTQDRPHICSLCGKDFVRKYELNKHMKQLHWGFTVGEDGNESMETSNSDSLLNRSAASSQMNTSDAMIELKPHVSLLNASRQSSPEGAKLKTIVNIKTEKV